MKEVCHHSSQLSGPSAVCNSQSLNSKGHSKSGQRGAKDISNPDVDMRTELQRENDELRGNSFPSSPDAMLYADLMLDSKDPGPRGGS